MPRRRYPRFGRVEKPAPIKIARPKVDAAPLAAAYEWYAVDPLTALRSVLSWYGSNLSALLFQNPLTSEQQRWYDKAVKAQNLGDSAAATEAERIQAWTTAVRLFERVWASKYKLPTIDAIASKPTSRRVAAIQRVLNSLNEVFSEFSVQFRMSTGTDRELTPDGILVPEQELVAMVGEPPLRIALTEAVTVAKVKAATRTADGQAELDGDQFFTVLPQVLAAVYAWAAKFAGGALFKASRTFSTKQPRPARSTTTTAPRSRVPVASTDPFGIFRPNTVKALIASILADHKDHAVTDLRAVCAQHGTTDAPLYFVLRQLKSKGNRVIVYSNNRKVVRVEP
jgi:hypothetical protein